MCDRVVLSVNYISPILGPTFEPKDENSKKLVDVVQVVDTRLKFICEIQKSIHNQLCLYTS